MEYADSECQESHYSLQENYFSLTLSHFCDLTVPKELWLTNTEPFQWSFCVKNYVLLTLIHFNDLIVPREPLFLARELCLTDHWAISVISLFQESHYFWQENYVSLTLSQKRAIFPGKITMSHWHWAISVISLCQKELWLTDTEPFQWSHCAKKSYESLTLSHFSYLTVPF